MGNNYKLNLSILALFIVLMLDMFQAQAVIYVAHVHGLYSSEKDPRFKIIEPYKGSGTEPIEGYTDRPSFDIYVEYSGLSTKTEGFDNGVAKVSIPLLEGNVTNFSITPEGFIKNVSGVNFPFSKDKEERWTISEVGHKSASDYLRKGGETNPSEAQIIEFMNYNKEITGYMPLFLNKTTTAYRAIMLNGIYHISKVQKCEKEGCKVS